MPSAISDPCGPGQRGQQVLEVEDTRRASADARPGQTGVTTKADEERAAGSPSVPHRPGHGARSRWTLPRRRSTPPAADPRPRPALARRADAGWVPVSDRPSESAAVRQSTRGPASGLQRRRAPSLASTSKRPRSACRTYPPAASADLQSSTNLLEDRAPSPLSPQRSHRATNYIEHILEIHLVRVTASAQPGRDRTPHARGRAARATVPATRWPRGWRSPGPGRREEGGNQQVRDGVRRRGPRRRPAARVPAAPAFGEQFGEQLSSAGTTTGAARSSHAGCGSRGIEFQERPGRRTERLAAGTGPGGPSLAEDGSDHGRMSRGHRLPGRGQRLRPPRAQQALGSMVRATARDGERDHAPEPVVDAGTRNTAVARWRGPNSPGGGACRLVSSSGSARGPGASCPSTAVGGEADEEEGPFARRTEPLRLQRHRTSRRRSAHDTAPAAAARERRAAKRSTRSADSARWRRTTAQQPGPAASDDDDKQLADSVGGPRERRTSPALRSQ